MVDDVVLFLEVELLDDELVDDEVPLVDSSETDFMLTTLLGSTNVSRRVYPEYAVISAVPTMAAAICVFHFMICTSNENDRIHN